MKKSRSTKRVPKAIQLLRNKPKVVARPIVSKDEKMSKSRKQTYHHKKEFSDHTVYYNEQDQLHRLDGPAREWSNGNKSWYQNGKLHRLDGPAIEYVDGYKAWYIDGKLHRLDGPAVEWLDGSKWWYIDDKRLTEEEFNQRTSQVERESRKSERLDKDTGLPKPKSKYGYTEAEVKDILFERFGRWMRGQTIMMEKDEFIYYQCDVYRYVNGLPVID